MKVTLVLSALISCALFISISGKSPILIVPGLMGSQLKAKVKTLDCHTRWGYKLFWFGPRTLNKLCLNKLKMRFKKGKFYDEYFTRVKVYKKKSDFGSTKPVECIAKTPLGCAYKYLKSFLKYFTKRGYTKGTNIAAAAYDWRLSPYELKKKGYFSEVKDQIQRMFKKSGKKRVTIVGHSYGGVVMLYFLTEMVDQTWKNKHIKAFIPLGAPFGGATKVVGALVYGKLPIDLKYFKLIATLAHKLILLPVLRTFPSLYFLLPRPDVFQDKKLVYIKTWGTSSYTAKDYKKILTYKRGFSMYQAVKDRNKNYKPRSPGVDTYCMYGTGQATPDWYKVSFGKRKEKKDNRGDGTVDWVSLNECSKWSKTVTEFKGLDHMDIVKKNKVFEVISNIVLS